MQLTILIQASVRVRERTDVRGSPWNIVSGWSARMKPAIENLQRVLQLLGMQGGERPRPHVALLHSARANVFNAATLLELHPDRAEIRTSVIELLLKAELALAAVDTPNADLSFRIADQLLLEARVRVEALNAGSR